jgi:hypothetical protein
MLCTIQVVEKVCYKYMLIHTSSAEIAKTNKIQGNPKTLQPPLTLQENSENGLNLAQLCSKWRSKFQEP